MVLKILAWHLTQTFYQPFLPVLDSVSRAHGMGLQHVVRLSSGVSIHNWWHSYLRTY